jgi:hypothetical protein
LTTPITFAIVIHNYRWRLGLAEGEPSYDELERRLAPGLAIKVPTITLEGDANGAPHPDASAYAGKFVGRRRRRSRRPSWTSIGIDRHAGASHPPGAAAESHASAESEGTRP